MEITGVTKGLRLLPEGVKAEFWIDAKYALNTVGAGPLDPKGPSGWIKGWKTKGWKKADGEDVGNLEEVKALWRELTRHCSAGTKIDFKWVKSHSGVEGNERADELAKEGRKKFQKK
jgi:ribonuclease HI